MCVQRRCYSWRGNDTILCRLQKDIELAVDQNLGIGNTCGLTSNEESNFEPAMRIGDWPKGLTVAGNSKVRHGSRRKKK